MRYFIPLFVLAWSLNLSADDTASSLPPPGHRARPYNERAEVEQARMEKEKESEATTATKSMAKAAAPTAKILFNTSHKGAHHQLLMMDPLAEWMEIDDGSRWYINPNQRRITYNWSVFDTIVITPNHAWFSSFEFCATNINKNQTVEIKIKGRPIPNEVNAHWIIGIDSIRQEICLEDGSVWKLDGWDSNVYRNWATMDYVIIGVNDSVWSKTSYPNILINVETYDYTSSRCTY